MSTLPTLDIDTLSQAVAGGAAAIRAVTRLQPAGGPGDKVFPPTYAVDKGVKYALEERTIGGERVLTVLLDSVASQANRVEEALYAGWEAGRLHFPVISVDFSGEEGLDDLDRISTLHAPHRIADAILRDAVDEGGTRFRDTPVGMEYTNASARNATAIYRFCPHALVLGVWDSTGPKGGMGNKIQRALVSEIVGVGVVTGKKTSSRLDPLGVVKGGAVVYHLRGSKKDWTLDPDEAEREAGKAKLFAAKKGEGSATGAPSAVNHSNVAPTVDELAGGVTIDHALQTVVLSLAALRKLRFLQDCAGRPLPREERPSAETAARTALAALALAGVTGARAEGYHLRSRSLLVPEGGEGLVFEVLPSEGGEPRRYTLDAAGAAALLKKAHAAAAAQGFPWDREPMVLKPAPKLADLVRKSRAAAAAGEGEGEGAE